MRFEILRDTTDEYTWQLVDDDRNVLAESGVSFPTKTGCLAAIETIRRSHGAYLLDLTVHSDRLSPSFRVMH
jgi:uncharacterized protein YegP (UPF0339 family)